MALNRRDFLKATSAIFPASALPFARVFALVSNGNWLHCRSAMRNSNTVLRPLIARSTALLSKHT